MRTLRRYFLKDFLKLYAVIGIGLSLIITLMDVIKRVDDLLPHDPSAGAVAYYAALGFPRYFLYIMPVAALLCSLFTVGHASRTRETVAVMAAGGRVKALFMPIVISGAVLSLLGFALGEFVVPACSIKAREVKNGIMGKRPFPSVFKEGKLWLRANDGSIVRIGLYVEETDSFRDMSVFRLGRKRLEEIIKADVAEYSEDEGCWVLGNVRSYNTATGRVREMQSMRYYDLDSPRVFGEEVKKPYEMGLMELMRYLDRLKKAGFKNLRLSVEMHSKVSYPLVSLFMVVLGISFAAKRTMGGLVATAVGLVASLLYWFGYTMSLSLGYAGILPPIAAAWLMPLVFGVAAGWLYSKIPE